MNDKKNRKLLIGCGILKKEINWLISRNNWQINTFFIDSSLHTDIEMLHKKLIYVINRHTDNDRVIFYGACHPQIDDTLKNANLTRTCGQNCIEMLLGQELFMEELSNGAYFLLEDWALRWNVIVKKTFGKNFEITRQIFHEDRKFMLALRTPCSIDFKKYAENAAKSVDLPLKWMDVKLDNLKLVVESLIKKTN